MAQTNRVSLSVAEAAELAKSGLLAVGYVEEDAQTICSHIIDTELRGYGAAGLARVVAIADRPGTNHIGSAEMVITRETAASAQLDAKNAIGYLAAYKATEMAIQKARTGGIGIVGVSNTFMAGMLSYYGEMAAKEDLVLMMVASAGPWVAPHGSSTPRFGTNPMCIAFPSGKEQPIIWDIGTSKIVHAQIQLAQLMGEDIPEDTAYDADGNVTKDPFKAMQGAMAVWGGHKGSGLAVAIQLLGAMAGAPAHTADREGWGLLAIAMDPEMFRPIDEFKKEIDGYSETIRSSVPLEGSSPVRMPFDRSWETREKNRAGGVIEVEESVVQRLQKLTQKIGN